MKIESIVTPIVIIDKATLMKNLKTVADISRKHKINLRPHIKTHNIPELAHMQIKEGACGVTVANLRESKAMIDSGIKDIFIARQVVDSAELIELTRQMKKALVSIGVDSIEGAKIASAVMSKKSLKLKVLIEIDTGGKRCGLTSTSEIIKLAEVIRSLPGLIFNGIFTHEGHVYGAKTKTELIKLTQQAIQKMAHVAEVLKKKEFSNFTVSIGSTPSIKYASDFKVITEIRPGNYIFNDAMQVANGSAKPDECALKVIATVMSKPTKNRVVLNVGSKLMGSDRGKNISDSKGYGIIISPEKHIITRLYEEHSIIEGKNSLKIGQRVSIIPGHACITANLAKELYLVDAVEKVIQKL